MLKKSLEHEKTKISKLNDQLLELKQKIHESELNDSLESPLHHNSLHIKIETKSIESSPYSKNKSVKNFKPNFKSLKKF